MQKQDHHEVQAAGRRGKLYALLALCLALMTSAVATSGSAAESAKPTQFEVEAAYLFNFGKFITWPQNSAAGNTFVICVLGEDPFGSVLDRTVTGEAIGSRQVEARRIMRAQDVKSCAILYISNSESNRLTKILASLNNAPVLTVSDIPDFIAQGGMIQFVLRDGRVRFEVNLAPAEQDGLTMSSELLKVAVEVKRDKGGVR